MNRLEIKASAHTIASILFWAKEQCNIYYDRDSITTGSPTGGVLPVDDKVIDNFRGWRLVTSFDFYADETDTFLLILRFGSLVTVTASMDGE